MSLDVQHPSLPPVLHLSEAAAPALIGKLSGPILGQKLKSKNILTHQVFLSIDKSE